MNGEVVHYTVPGGSRALRGHWRVTASGVNGLDCLGNISFGQPAEWQVDQRIFLIEKETSVKLKQTLVTLLTAVGMFLSSTASLADPAYPSKPIRIIVPFAPGGSVDMLGRAVGQKLSERLGQSVVIENRGGGGTVVGTTIAAKAPADGYTLLLQVSNLATNPSLHTKLPYDAATDLEPISLLAEVPVVIFAHPGFLGNDIKELLAFARKSGKLSFGSGGTGTTSHLTGELLKEKTGIAAEHISYKGGALALNDLMAAHIPISFHTTAQGLQSYNAKKVKALGVSSERRAPTMPDVPTFREQGIDMVTVEWYGMLAPAGTPAAVITRLNNELKQIVTDPSVRERLPSLHLVSSTPAAFGDLIRTETARWAALIKKAGIKAE